MGPQEKPNGGAGHGYPLQNLLNFTGAKKQGSGWVAPCPNPAHVDKDPSFGIWIFAGDDGRPTVGKKCRSKGCDVTELLRENRAWPIELNGHDQLADAARAPAMSAAGLPATFDALPFTTAATTFPQDAAPSKEPPTPPEQHWLSKLPLEQAHDYRDANGVVRWRVLRYVGEVEGARKKTFAPQTWDAEKHEWTFKAPTPRPLYGLDLLHARLREHYDHQDPPDERPAVKVLVVEGEATADAARKIEALKSHVVLSLYGGKGAIPQNDWVPLHGLDVTFWNDHDETWREDVKRMSLQLAQAGLPRVKFVDLPSSLPPKWDLADALPDGYGPESLRAMLNGAKPYGDKELKDIFAENQTLDDIKSHCVIVSEDEHVYLLNRKTRFTSYKAFELTFDYIPTGGRALVKLLTEDAEKWRRRTGTPGYICLTSVYEPGYPRVIRTSDGVPKHNLYIPPSHAVLDDQTFEQLETLAKPFLEHVRWLFSKEDADLLLKCAASLIQRPEVTPKHVTYLVGRKGVGKSVILEVLSKLVEYPNWALADYVDLKTGTWNDHYAHKVLVIVHELGAAQGMTHTKTIKGLVGDSHRLVAKKFASKEQIRQKFHVWGTVQPEEAPRPEGEDDRRTLVLWGTQQEKRPAEYYAKLRQTYALDKNNEIVEHTKDEAYNLAALYTYLLKYPLGDFNAAAQPPKTKGFFLLQTSQLTDEQRALRSAWFPEEHSAQSKILDGWTPEPPFDDRVQKLLHFTSRCIESGLISTKTNELDPHTMSVRTAARTLVRSGTGTLAEARIWFAEFPVRGRTEKFVLIRWLPPTLNEAEARQAAEQWVRECQNKQVLAARIAEADAAWQRTCARRATERARRPENKPF